MAVSQTQRPKFYEEQFLGASDLTAAVDYGRTQLARHSLGGHTWGITIGLQLAETPQPGGTVSVHLLPGYAWDGYGRPIVVLSPYRIPEEKFGQFKFDPAIDTTGKGRLIAVWLRYDERSTQNPRPGFEVCGTEDQRSRIEETFIVEIGDMNAADRTSGVTIASRLMSDPKTALQAFDPTAPVVYDESIPHQSLPDPTARARWLIPIGFVRWQPVSNQPGHFVARADGGPDKDTDKIRNFRTRYVGLVAEEIEAADGAIRLRNRGKDPLSSFFRPPTKAQLAATTNDLASDLVWVEGNLRVIGNTKLCAGKLDFRDQEGKDFGIPTTIQRAGDAGGGPRALQVVIGPKSQDTNRFAIGRLDGADVEEKFVVTSGGKVGIGTSTPSLNLEIRGPDFGRDEAAATLHLWGSRIGDVGGNVLFVRAFDGGVVAFDGTNNRLAVGTNQAVCKLQIKGDLALEKIPSGTARPLPANATMCWNDGTWLRLNQNLDFSKPIFGVHTPGVFAPGSLNVGGLGSWGDPGFGNVWIAGRVGIGTNAPALALDVQGDIGRDNGPETLHLWGARIGDVGGGILFARAIPGGVVAFDGVNNRVGVGTAAPVEALHVRDNFRVDGPLAMRFGSLFWDVISDERLKEDVTPVEDALNKLLQLRGVNFRWKESEKPTYSAGIQTGLVAQEVEKVMPEWVTTTSTGYKALSLKGFEALLIEALRELKQEIGNLNERLTKLETTEPSRPAKTTRAKSRTSKGRSSDERAD
jgi:hypothetical protein